MHVATLCGSHHSGSTNAVALDTVARRLRAAGVSVQRIDVSPDVPSFRPEHTDPPPEEVRRIIDAFRSADGVVFAIPEYAGGVPGWVKNITDWMVTAGALHERPAVVISAATAGGANAIEQMARTLTWQGAHVVAICSIRAPLTIVRDGEITDGDVVARLHSTADALRSVLAGERDAAHAASDALRPHGLELFDRMD